MKRLLLAAALTLFAATPALAQTVVLVRHAEKIDQSSDPVLSDAGQRRAEALAQRMSSMELGYVFISPLQRTALTAAPTAEGAGVTAIVVPLDAGAQAHAQETAARIRELGKDAVVLVVGHSNTIPLIIRALGANSADMAECEYDRFTTLNTEGGSVFSVVGRYGAPSTCP